MRREDVFVELVGGGESSKAEAVCLRTSLEFLKPDIQIRRM